MYLNNIRLSKNVKTFVNNLKEIWVRCHNFKCMKKGSWRSSNNLLKLVANIKESTINEKLGNFHRHCWKGIVVIIAEFYFEITLVGQPLMMKKEQVASLKKKKKNLPRLTILKVMWVSCNFEFMKKGTFGSSKKKILNKLMKKEISGS